MSGDRTTEGKHAAMDSQHSKLEERCCSLTSYIGLKSTARHLVGLASVLPWPLNSMARMSGALDHASAPGSQHCVSTHSCRGDAESGQNSWGSS